MKKLIIFDLDNTILKTGDCHNRLMCEIISKKYGISTEEAKKLKKESEKEASLHEKTETKQDFFDMFDKLFLEKIGVEYNSKNLKDFRSTVKEMDERFPFEVELYEGALEVLNSLKEKGYLIAILTGSHNKLKPVYTEDFVGSRRKRLLKTFEVTGLNKIIDQHFFAWDHETLKPDKKAFYLPLNHFSIEPKDAIMIGDKDKDIMAKIFGLTTILFNPRGGYRKETKPNYIVKSFKEILETVEKID